MLLFTPVRVCLRRAVTVSVSEERFNRLIGENTSALSYRLSSAVPVPHRSGRKVVAYLWVTRLGWKIREVIPPYHLRSQHDDDQ